ncbi:helix-turn-helix domain-containing protein [Desulfomicrobium sp. ZS1]
MLVPWAEPRSRFTLLMERWIIRCAHVVRDSGWLSALAETHMG